MGLQLRETLRRLCVEIGWSYAVFWRAIRLRDQMHLVWEDGQFERASGMSGFEAMDLLLKERATTLRNSRNGHLVEFGCQAEDRVGSPLHKMMATQVHVVGDGIVGQAALTGNHRWILQDTLGDYGSRPKGLTEMNHRFLAGMQTIAIIPVLPHGVVQLGSTQTVMENIGFINHVRSLFAQLVCVPGALVSDVSQTPLSQNNNLHASVGVPTTLNQSGNSDTYISRFSSPSGDKCHYELLDAPDSRSVSQPSCSLFTKLYDKIPANSSEASSTTAASTMMPLSDFSQPTIHPVVEPVHQHSQLESGFVGAQVIFSYPDARSIKNAMLHESCSGSQHQSQILTSGLSSSGLALLEEQLLFISGPRESANKNGPKLDNSRTPQLKSHSCIFSSSCKDSDSVLPLGRSESLNNVNDLVGCSSFPGGTTGSFRSQCPISSSMEVPQMLDPTAHSNGSQMLSGDSQPRHPTSIQKSQTVPTKGQQKKDGNLFKALDVPSTEFEEQISCYGSLLGTPQDGWLSSSDTVQESKRNTSAVSMDNDTRTTPTSQNIKGIDNSESLQVLNKKTPLSPVWPTSGNDLFDLLGLHNKSGGFHGSLDDVFVHDNDANAHELGADFSACITQLDMGPVYDALNEDICCSGLFSEASPDQLLDAVVAQINSVAKQNLDDDVSCKTSLAKISSSFHTSSATSGWVDLSEQKHGECLGLSPMLVKSEAAGSSSVISACSMDRTGGCSQKDGGYKSQISLWVENDQNINRDIISAGHGKRIDEVGKLNRKRPRPGENPRPRPKDRQMIQDRVKELRELVPNGAKCSIDALLEKTIKHMLFLQSVTKHAGKLKEVGEPKIMSKEGGLLLKDNFEGGATWAFEVGTRSMICPIIVEDLSPPRQMLVEMLCEERGLFLEIADLIRGLGLTILKGVMESRNDKVWARFAVEANRDVTRMEIFLSLVRLLEPNAGSSMVPQGVGSLNMPHNMFHPSSIPATGLSDRFR